MRKKPSPLIRKSMEAGWRLSAQHRRDPIVWAQGEREALIADALAAGRCVSLPPCQTKALFGQDMPPITNASGGWRVMPRRASL